VIKIDFIAIEFLKIHNVLNKKIRENQGIMLSRLLDCFISPIHPKPQIKE
jgi:hypothetical protein